MKQDTKKGEIKMNYDYLTAPNWDRLCVNSNNSYEIVQSLKRIRKNGYKYIACERKMMPIYKIIPMVVELGKERRSVEYIQHEIAYQFADRIWGLFKRDGIVFRYEDD